MSKRHNEDMYKMYGEYKETLKLCKKPLLKRQKLNAEIREKHSEPFKRRDYNDNKSDITNWNSMISELETNIKEIEMYLDFDDRYYLHKEYDNIRSMILNQNSYEGEIPLEGLYEECMSESDIIFTNELRDEIAEILCEILTERQQNIVDILFWKRKTQQEAAEILGITQQGVADGLEKSLNKLKNTPKIQALFREFKEVCS